MTFYSSISAASFAAIASGRRLIEPRLNDELHKKIRPGDLLVLTNRDTQKELLAKVVGVLRYPSFVEMFQASGVERFGAADQRELLTELRGYYSTQDELTHGVLGLKLHLLRR